MRSTRRATPLPFLLILLAACAWLVACSAAGANLPGPTPHLAPQAALPTPAKSSPMALTALMPTRATPYPTPTKTTPTIAPSPTLPVEYFISGIHGHKQFFPLGCETAAAKDWANFFNHDFNEFEFQYRLPQSDNPDLGFVGDVNSPWGQVPPYGYGVYAGPVADLLAVYGIPAKAYKNYTLAQIKASIAQDKPVIVWVIGNMVGGLPSTYTDKKGNQTIVAAYEHVVIVTGYSADHIRYINNGKFYDTPTRVFLNSWGVLGNMAIADQ